MFFLYSKGSKTTQYSSCSCISSSNIIYYPTTGDLQGRFLGLGFRRFLDNDEWRIHKDSVSVFYDGDLCSITQISATVSNFTMSLSATATT
jgi:hypothetical protein